MPTKNQQHFDSWAVEVDSISDPATQAQSLPRFKETKASYGTVDSALNQTRDAYIPLLSSLTSIQTALNQELTPRGLQSLCGPYAKVRQQAGDIHGIMRKAIAAIDSSMTQLAPVATDAPRWLPHSGRRM